MRKLSLLCFVLAACHDGAAVLPDLSSTDLGSDGAQVACGGEAGDFHSQTIESGGETRYYFLHVPSDYACTTAWPMLVDFHGTGTGEPTDPVEESWAYDEMITAADAQHFIVVRPRSRYKAVNGQNVFQWDINAGDPKRNLDFATALIADLSSRYHVDPARVYASGFSNGPSQALQFLTVSPPLVHGYMIISGGLNEMLSTTKQLTSEDGRVYVMVGFRDYMWSTTRALFSFLTSHGFDQSRLWQRESNTGHELYGWHYDEAFAWMDRGERKPAGTVSTGWQAETLTGSPSITTIARAADGTLAASGTVGIYRRATDGTWTQSMAFNGEAQGHINGLCFQGSALLAVGEGQLLKAADGQHFTAATPIPDFDMTGFAGSYMNGIACSDTIASAGGLWASAMSTNGGDSWSETMMTTSGAPAFVTVVRRSQSGTFVAAGYYDYLGRSTDGINYADVSPPTAMQWWNDVASDEHGGWWAVGEKGNVVHSTDDGATFSPVTVPTSEDLYAVAFADAQNGIIAGAHGAAFVTHDGGAHFDDVSTGLDGYVGAAVWLDASNVLLAGEHGAVLRRSF